MLVLTSSSDGIPMEQVQQVERRVAAANVSVHVFRTSLHHHDATTAAGWRIQNVYPPRIGERLDELWRTVDPR